MKGGAEQTPIQKALILAQWLGMILCVVSLVVVFGSHYLIVNGHTELWGLEPVNVKDTKVTVILMFPGAIILAVSSLILKAKYKAK